MDKLKPKTKTKMFFVDVNEKFNNFFVQFEKGGTRKHFLEGEKKFQVPFLKCIAKSKCHQQKIWFLVFTFNIFNE